MRLNWRRLAAAAIVLLIILQLQPLFHSAGASPMFKEGAFIVNKNSSGSNSVPVSVFVPPGEHGVTSILGSYLSSRGIQMKDYGLLSYFNMPANNSQIVSELKQLQKDFGIQYYTSSSQALAFPAYAMGNASPFQQTANEYVPSQIRTAYNFTYPLTHNITGKGTTIALVDAFGDPNIRYDVNAFDNVTGLPPTNLNIQYPNNFHSTSYNKSWAIETSTDVEWAHALAPGAKIVLVIAQNASVASLDNALSYVVSNHLANIVSLSWGLPENQLGRQGVNTFSGVYKYAAESGITILAATGDYGAYDQQNTPTVNFPSSDPYAVAVGGTSLYPSGNQYEQSAWGGNLSGSSYGSGGGYSEYFKSPWWQSAPGFSSNSRGTPDVSMNANKNTGMLVISQAKEYKIGGTSISTPMWADVISLMDQTLNRSVGFVNPLLYQISRTADYKSSFYDITTGNNGYYNAVPGWDAATGLGTPKVSSLLNTTRDLLAPYGDVGIINGTGYNASGMQATLKLAGSPSSETNNGSTFYYIGSYMNGGNFLKFGISVNNTTVSRGYILSQNGIKYSSFQPIGTFNGATHYYNLTLQYQSGSQAALSDNAQQTTLNFFMENLGKMRMSFGAEQDSSMTNLTDIPAASFNNVQLIRNGTLVSPKEVYQSHYSSLDIPGYSSINMAYSSSRNFTVSYSSKATDTNLSSYSGTLGPAIAYNLSYSKTPTGTFSLLGSGYSSSSASWYVNGKLITGDQHTFTSGGTYNITATYGIPASSVTRFISVPNMTEMNITASSGIPYDSSPLYRMTANYFYKYSGTGKIKVPALSGNNEVNVSSYGFNTASSAVSGGADSIFHLTPMNVTLSVLAYPGNATVKFNGKNISQSGGLHIESLSPNTTAISISSPGYTPLNYNINLMPGVNQSSQNILRPLNASRMSILQGNVSDALYNFGLGHVNISLKNGGYAFTNSTGYFILFLNPGNYNLSFLRSLYQQKYVSLNVTGTSKMTLSVLLYPKNINGTIPTINITREFPLLFYFGYISWSKYTGGGFAAYRVYISTNPSMANYRTVTVTNQNTTFAFVSGIMPGKEYYVAVSVYLLDGELYSTNPVHMGYSNPFVIFANVAILAGIVAYAVMAVRYVGRMKKKREIKL